MTSPAQQPPPEDPQTQPQDSELVQHIAELLLVGAGLAALVAALLLLLKPLKLGAESIGAAARLALAVGPLNIDPVGMPGSPFQARRGDGEASRNTLQSEVYFRAAYLLNAAKRIDRDRRAGKPLIQAVRNERRFFDQHRDAQSRRAEAARTVDEAAKMHGPLLGWYAKKDNRTSAECLAADGQNFPVDRRPAIGYPGTVHPHCRCRPGAPFKDGGMLSLSRRPPRRVRKVA